MAGNPRTQIPSKSQTGKNPETPTGGSIIWPFGGFFVYVGFGFWVLGFPPLAAAAWDLGFETWDFRRSRRLFTWDLEFGIWDFPRQRAWDFRVSGSVRPARP